MANKDKPIRIDRAKAETQAKNAMKAIHNAGVIKSVGTFRDYKTCLTAFTQFIKDTKQGDLRHTTREIAEQYLHARSTELAQKTLDMHRQAIQAFFVARGDMTKTEHLEIVKSTVETVLEHRAYTPAQVERVAAAQTERNAFSTRLAYACGLRAHELLTIRPLREQPTDVRHYENGEVKSLETKWQGRAEGVPYSVVGKGGLIREVRVPEHLARELETHRLETPKEVTDRGVRYQSHYDLAGGKSWSNSFSAASTRALGWSTGAHGLRHSYAQERMVELQRSCMYSQALETVSQEMGHFREDITTTYLR